MTPFNRIFFCPFFERSNANQIKQCILMLALLLSASATSSELNLAPNESFVIADAGMHMMTFEEKDTGKRFIVQGLNIRGKKKFKGSEANKNQVPIPTKVEAGHYYLKRITPIFKNIGKKRFKKPKCEECFFTVKSNAVVYLGRWNIDFDGHSLGTATWKIQREYSNANLKSLREKNPELMNFPLFVSNEEGTIIEISWNDL